jgi:predicted 3-demethylubiquinone-9 3-methyltransferase (glyoxalase superfamily)
MPNRPIVPCLWLDDQAEAAAAFYIGAFPAGRLIATSRYPADNPTPSGKPPGSVLAVEFEVAGQRFTALNGGPRFSINPSISFFVHVDSPDEAERVFARLAEGGQVLMPIAAYPWSERFGWAKDRFGVSWQVITGRREPNGATIVPCLMFSGAQHRNAEPAIGHYTRIFPNSRVGLLERYAAGEGTEGTIKHGRFVLDGQEMVVMDSHMDHGFGFNEGLSLQVMCEDQATLDHYWAALAEGGAPSQCGWLKDRFGVSWQITPAAMAGLLASGDAQANARAFKAMLGMQKLEIAAIEAAFRGA